MELQILNLSDNCIHFKCEVKLLKCVPNLITYLAGDKAVQQLLPFLLRLGPSHTGLRCRRRCPLGHLHLLRLLALQGRHLRAALRQFLPHTLQLRQRSGVSCVGVAGLVARVRKRRSQQIVTFVRGLGGEYQRSNDSKILMSDMLYKNMTINLLLAVTVEIISKQEVIQIIV